ncbi:MAG: hypothetical protein JO305_10090 [Alphaproteobacteria bacterium]|nr:hypothetical protein [Alphaproteobacteria bacterium]
MRFKSGLITSAAALACLWAAPNAFAASVAGGIPITLSYSAETVTLNGNTVAVASGFIRDEVNTTLSGAGTGGATSGGTITFTAPTGSTFTGTTPNAVASNCLPANTPCTLNIVTGAGGNQLVYQVPPGLQVTAFAVIQLNAVLTTVPPSPAISITNLNGLASTNFAPGGPAFPTFTVQAQVAGGAGAAAAESDTAPVPSTNLTSSEAVTAASAGDTPTVDLTSAGMAMQFTTNTGGVSKQVSLGSFTISQNTSLFDARNGNQLAGVPPSPGTFLTGSATVTITGDFSTITQAFLITNPTSPASPTVNANTCFTAAPASPVTVTNNTLTFPISAIPTTSRTWFVCAVTNGTGVIISNGNTTEIGRVNNGTFSTITISVNLTGISAPINLLAANTAFFGFTYNGSVSQFYNVFGAANGYPSFFRIVNTNNTTAPIFATFQPDAGGALLTANISNAFPVGLGTYVSADAIAAAAGTKLNAGGQHATITLFSPLFGVRFTALSQNAGNLDIESLP